MYVTGVPVRQMQGRFLLFVFRDGNRQDVCHADEDGIVGQVRL